MVNTRRMAATPRWAFITMAECTVVRIGITMRYIELFQQAPLTWSLFLVYMAVTAWLAWLGHRRTQGIESFAVGNGDMHPIIVGVTLAASIASTATFVLNPGFIYTHGVAALMHFGVAAGGGAIIGLVLMSTGFRRIGERHSAITLPHWVAERYGSRAMSVWLSIATMLTFTFIVLIIGALATVMQSMLGLTKLEGAILVVGFVFSYVFVGGAYAHAFTNTLQGIIMVCVAILMVAAGFHYLWDDGLSRLAEQGEHLVALVNTKSPLFGTSFGVWVCGFIIGFAIICQPHILTKALYVKSDAAVRKYLGVAIVVSLIFSSLLLIGLYVRLMELPPDALIDPATMKFNQDLVVPTYVANTFGPNLSAVITVAILAAGMSTLDGLLVALSSIAGFDLFVRLMPEHWQQAKSPEEKSALAQRAGQVILIIFGLAAIPFAVNPPGLLAIFGMLGVFGVVVAAVGPVFFGVFLKKPPRTAVFCASVLGTGLHLGLYLWGKYAIANGLNLQEVVRQTSYLPEWLFDMGAWQLGFALPWVTATYGILLSFLIVLVALCGQRLGHSKQTHTSDGSSVDGVFPPDPERRHAG